MANEQDPQTRAHSELLQKILEAELHDQIKVRDDLLLNGVITYDNCWIIFELGVNVFTMFNGHKAAVRLVQGKYRATQSGAFYTLDCKRSIGTVGTLDEPPLVFASDILREQPRSPNWQLLL